MAPHADRAASQRLKVTPCVFESHSCCTCQLLQEKIAAFYPVKVEMQRRAVSLLKHSVVPQKSARRREFPSPPESAARTQREVGAADPERRPSKSRELSAQLAELAATITAPPPAVASGVHVGFICAAQALLDHVISLGSDL